MFSCKVLKKLTMRLEVHKPFDEILWGIYSINLLKSAVLPPIGQEIIVSSLIHY